MANIKLLGHGLSALAKTCKDRQITMPKDVDLIDFTANWSMDFNPVNRHAIVTTNNIKSYCWPCSTLYW